MSSAKANAAFAQDCRVLQNENEKGAAKISRRPTHFMPVHFPPGGARVRAVRSDQVRLTESTEAAETKTPPIFSIAPEEVNSMPSTVPEISVATGTVGRLFAS